MPGEGAFTARSSIGGDPVERLNKAKSYKNPFSMMIASTRMSKTAAEAKLKEQSARRAPTPTRGPTLAPPPPPPRLSGLPPPRGRARTPPLGRRRTHPLSARDVQWRRGTRSRSSRSCRTCRCSSRPTRRSTPSRPPRSGKRPTLSVAAQPLWCSSTRDNAVPRKMAFKAMF